MVDEKKVERVSEEQHLKEIKELKAAQEQGVNKSIETFVKQEEAREAKKAADAAAKKGTGKG